MSTILPAKRKRNQVSYLVPDEDDLPDVDGIKNDYDESRGSDSDDDDEDEFLPGRKASKRTKLKGRRRKKVKTDRSSRKPKDEKPFPFLALPPELRDIIYDIALSDADGAVLVSKFKSFRRNIRRVPGSTVPSPKVDESNSRWRWGWNSRQAVPAPSAPTQPLPTLMPNFLAVSKQTYAEGINYLYRRPIIVDNTYTLHTFLSLIGPTNRARLTDITIRGWGEGRGVRKIMNYVAMSLLASCTNLENLMLDCVFYRWQYSPERIARAVFRDSHLFLEALGVARGKKDAAVDVLDIYPGNFKAHAQSVFSFSRSQTEEANLELRKRFDEELRKLLTR